jgi:hypothetical protein
MDLLILERTVLAVIAITFVMGGKLVEDKTAYQ